MGAWGSIGKDSLAKCLYEEAVSSSQDTLWSKANCNEAGNGVVKGLPVDAVCASVADVCRRKSTTAACKNSGCTWSSGSRCKWSAEDGCQARSTKAECGTDRCKWANGACTWNRDAKNNVCLHPPTGHSALPDATLNCANILKGKCPPSWEVPTGCCLSEHSKYEMLLESTPGFVCCNAPCTSLEASFKAGTKVHLFALPSVTTATGLVVSNQTVCNGNMGSTLCAPGMRRYFSNGMGRQGGMMDMNMQLATMGMFSLGPNGIKLANSMSIFNDIYGNPGFGTPGMMGPFGPMGSMGQPGLMGGQFGTMGGMNPMMGPMMGSMPQNRMMGGMPSTTMGNMGPTSTMGMYGSYPQGYGQPVQGNGQPGHGPWATEPVYPTQENSTAQEQPAGQPISPPQHPVYPQYPGFPQQPLHQQQPFYQPRPVSHHNQQPGYYQPPQASYYQHPMMPVYRPTLSS